MADDMHGYLIHEDIDSDEDWSFGFNYIYS